MQNLSKFYGKFVKILCKICESPTQYLPEFYAKFIKILRKINKNII